MLVAFLLGGTVTVFAMLIAAAGLVVARRHLSAEDLRANHDVASSMIAVLGTLYAIVLGLVVVDALQHRETAQTMESNEGNALATILHIVRTIPVEQRIPILKAELKYSQLAIDREWPKLKDQTAPDEDTVHAFGDLWQVTAAYDPKTPREQNLHEAILQAMTQMSDARRYRNVQCHHGTPLMLWMVLITGAFATVGATYFFGAEHFKVQMVMTMLVTLVLCMNILLVFFYGRPYNSELQIRPHALTHVRDLLQHMPVLKPGYTEAK